MPSFTRIDELLRPGHRHLEPGDDCYFLWEYTAGLGYEGSATNQLLLNLKKSPAVRNTPQWPHKLRAIKKVAAEVGHACGPDLLTQATFVPVPPSKVRLDPEHDDRLVSILRASGARDVRELVVQRESTEPGHTLEYWERPGPNELLGLYQIDEALVDPQPLIVVIFDDLLRSGAHFSAMKHLLRARFADPEPYIFGLFVARVVPPPED